MPSPSLSSLQLGSTTYLCTFFIASSSILSSEAGWWRGHLLDLFARQACDSVPFIQRWQRQRGKVVLCRFCPVKGGGSDRLLSNPFARGVVPLAEKTSPSISTCSVAARYL